VSQLVLPFTRTCSIGDCDNGGQLRRGWCQKHYRRWQQHGDPLIALTDQANGRSHYERVMSMVEPVGDCLFFRGLTDSGGYGKIGCTRAHRIVAAHFLGDPPADKPYVLHDCDIRCCVAIDHLRYGTHADNMADMVRRRRSAIGEKHGRAKLTADDVRAIRIDARTQRMIAEDYGISKMTIQKICRHTTWKHLT
jgi:hypothetical protein